MSVEKAKVEQQKNMLSNLASLGILAASFGHETVDWAGNIVKFAERLDEDVIAKAWWLHEAERPGVQKTMSYLVSESRKLRKFAKFTLGNVSREKRTKATFCVRQVLVNVFKAFKEVMEDEKKIRSELPTEGHFPIEGYPMDWESIFVNLILNAAWAMEDTPPDNRKIRVQIIADGTEFVIQFEDAGRGLEAGTEEVVFQPTFTTKRNERGEDVGTGLGLTIVKSFVEVNTGGTIIAKQRGELGGAVFIIRVPRSSKPAKKENQT
jgi:signal transduction histidine kinase